MHAGLAFGSVLFRGGDVYGPVVNIAARLSSLARKGTIRVDHAMATELADAKEFTVSTRTPRPVRGYPQLPSYRLRRSGSAETALTGRHPTALPAIPMGTSHGWPAGFDSTRGAWPPPAGRPADPSPERRTPAAQRLREPDGGADSPDAASAAQPSTSGPRVGGNTATRDPPGIGQPFPQPSES